MWAPGRTPPCASRARSKATEKKTNPKLEEEIWRATLAARAEQADKDDEVEVPKHRWFQTWAFDPEPIKMCVPRGRPTSLLALSWRLRCGLRVDA